MPEQHVRPEGDKIRSLRTKRAWTQEMLAQKTGVSKRTIENLERGSPVRLQSLRLVAEALGVDPSELTSGRGEPVRVFLSYASHDKPAIRELHQRLTREGFTVWFDDASLAAGHDLITEIERGIERSDVLIACISKNTAASKGWVKKELDLALRRGTERALIIIPALLEDCEVPTSLLDRRWVRLYEPGGYDSLIRALRDRENGPPAVGIDFGTTNTTAVFTRSESADNDTTPHLEIAFEESISAEDVKGALTALADYFRACGGLGLRVDEWDLEEAHVAEPVDA